MSATPHKIKLKNISRDVNIDESLFNYIFNKNSNEKYKSYLEELYLFQC